jgi:hypothetical protein
MLEFGFVLFDILISGVKLTLEKFGVEFAL